MSTPVIFALTSPPLQIEFEDREATASQKPTGYFSRVWVNWFDAIWTRLTNTATVVKRITRKGAGAGESASIALTAITLGTLSAGLYRISWRFRVMQAASTSSEVFLTLHSTDNGASCSEDAPSMTSNNTGLPKSGELLVAVDTATALSYSTTYVSVGATPMKYKLDLVVEAVSAG